MTASSFAARPASRQGFLIGVLLFALLALGVTRAEAQQFSPIGKWQGTSHGATFTLVIQPNGQYVHTLQSGGAVGHHTGPYQLLGSNRIFFTVPNSSAGGPKLKRAPATESGFTHPGHPELPLGTLNTLVFNGPDRVVFIDEMTHRSVAMSRVPNAEE